MTKAFAELVGKVGANNAIEWIQKVKDMIVVERVVDKVVTKGKVKQ